MARSAKQNERVPTAEEAEAMAGAMTRYKEMPVRPEMAISFSDEGATAALGPIHSDGNGHAAMLHEAVGSSSNGWLNGMMIDLLKVAKERGASEVTGEQATMEYGNLATKMMRTVTAQMDALGKMRRGGEQVVRHVHVYEGGQAIVADQFNHYGGENGNAGGQPYAPFEGHAPSRVAPLLGQDAAGHGVPVAGDQGKEAVPNARGQKPRRSSRKQA